MSMFLKANKKSKNGEPSRMSDDPGAPMLKTTNYFQFPGRYPLEQKKAAKKKDRKLDSVFYDDDTQADPMANVVPYILNKPRAPGTETTSEESEETDSSESEEDTESEYSSEEDEETETASSEVDELIELDIEKLGVMSSGIKMPNCGSTSSEDSEPKSLKFVKKVKTSARGIKTPNCGSSSSDSEPEPQILKLTKMHAKAPDAFINLVSSEDEDEDGVQHGTKRKHGSSTTSQRKKTVKKLSSTDYY